jgi:magnesium transporter
MRTARYNDDTEEIRLGELSVLFNEQLIVTVRYGHASPLDQVRKHLEDDPEWLRHGPAAVAASVVGRVIEDFRPALDGFEKDVVETEHEVFADTRDFPISRLYHLKRQVLDLALVTDAFREPLTRLIRTKKMMHEVEVLADMHEHIELLDRLVARTRTLSDLIDTALDATMTQVSLQQNEDMRRISAWVAIAAVPTAIAGIYGMNFDHMPELRSEYGYYFVIGFMVIVCVTLHRVFRRTGWL